MQQRYTAVAIFLHWAIALAIVGNLVLGWWMHEAIDVPATQARAIVAYQLHKSLGLTILVLSLVRLGWRLLHPVPPLPAAMPAWEKLAARAVHWAFYALMLGIPISGWLYVSVQWRGATALNVPTLWFGLFEVPHLFGLNERTPEARRALAAPLLDAHAALASAAVALLVLHVAAALKHHFLNRDAVLTGMLPLRSGRATGTLWAGSAVVVIAAGAIGWAVLRAPDQAASQPDVASDLSGSNWWVISGSQIRFSGVHAGTPFDGRFTRWRAGIRFDPANPDDSTVVAEIETASAEDGDPMHEEALPDSEWFDVERYPIATYRSTEIRLVADNQFELHGTLTIKDRKLSLPPLTLKVDGERLSITGRVVISRREANLGMDSDPNAEYVSDEIPVEVNLTARKL